MRITIQGCARIALMQALDHQGLSLADVIAQRSNYLVALLVRCACLRCCRASARRTWETHRTADTDHRLAKSFQNPMRHFYLPWCWKRKVVSLVAGGMFEYFCCVELRVARCALFSCYRMGIACWSSMQLRLLFSCDAIEGHCFRVVLL